MQTEDLERSLAGGSAFDAHYGLEMTACDDGGARGRVEVGAQLLQPTGVVHGGVYASVAEALASSGTNWAVTPNDEVGLGMSNNTSFLRPVSGGVLEAVAIRSTAAARPGSGTCGSPTSRGGPAPSAG